MFNQQLVKERQAALLIDADQRRRARMQPREPLVRIRLTLEFQLGNRTPKTADL
jgi:hypothetical protein